MRWVGYGLAVAIGLLGVVFIAGNQGVVLRIVVGIVMLAAAIALVVAMRLRPRVVEQRITQKVEIGGDVKLERLECQECGAALAKQAITVENGTVLVSCPYCQAGYQLEEEPKW